jgi:hypothetical protein
VTAHIEREYVPISGQLCDDLIPATRMKSCRMGEQDLLATGLTPFEDA